MRGSSEVTPAVVADEKNSPTPIPNSVIPAAASP